MYRRDLGGGGWTHTRSRAHTRTAVVQRVGNNNKKSEIQEKIDQKPIRLIPSCRLEFLCKTIVGSFTTAKPGAWGRPGNESQRQGGMSQRQDGASHRQDDKPL